MIHIIETLGIQDKNLTNINLNLPLEKDIQIFYQHPYWRIAVDGNNITRSDVFNDISFYFRNPIDIDFIKQESEENDLIKSFNNIHMITLAIIGDDYYVIGVRDFEQESVSTPIFKANSLTLKPRI